MSYIVDKFIKKSGKYNYAYVVMVINDNIYANPGIIFAESLKRVGCMCDIVAMVDNKINKDTINLLNNFFNKIIRIDKIEINHPNSIQNIILSKINVFKMIEYDKIFLIDVDTIIFTNLDKFFIEEEFANNSKELIYMADIKNYGFILIRPSNDIYSKCLKIISEHRSKLIKSAKPFEFVLSNIYKLTDIKKINCNISYDSYSNVDCIQYRKNKPFLMESNLTIQQRQNLNHFKVWFSYLSNIINKFPEIREYKCVSESIEISKYFLSSLSRFIVDFVKLNKSKKMSNTINIYGANNYKKIEYYHLDMTKEYTNKFIKYDMDTYDIKLFLEYLDTISIKNKNTKSKSFISYNSSGSSKLLIDKLQKDDINMLYLFLNNYIKMFSNTFVIIETDSKNKLFSNEAISDLKNNLIYKQNFKLKNTTLKNIIFNLYQNFTYNQRIQFITKLMDKNKSDTIYELTLSIYEMTSSIISYDQNYNLDLFIFYEQSSKIRLSSIFFNPNTINYYDTNTHTDSKLNFPNIFGIESNSKINNLNLLQIISMIYLQSLKKFIFSVYSGDEINNIGLYYEKYDKIILIDNNKHSVAKIKNINTNKIFFLTIIFSSSSQYKSILKEKKINPNTIYCSDKYWEYEGIKIMVK